MCATTRRPTKRARTRVRYREREDFSRSSASDRRRRRRRRRHRDDVLSLSPLENLAPPLPPLLLLCSLIAAEPIDRSRISRSYTRPRATTPLVPHLASATTFPLSPSFFSYKRELILLRARESSATKHPPPAFRLSLSRLSAPDLDRRS